MIRPAISFVIINTTEKILLDNNYTPTDIKTVITETTTQLYGDDYDFIHLQGTWGKERNIERRKLVKGEMSVETKYSSNKSLTL